MNSYYSYLTQKALKFLQEVNIQPFPIVGSAARAIGGSVPERARRAFKLLQTTPFGAGVFVTKYLATHFKTGQALRARSQVPAWERDSRSSSFAYPRWASILMQVTKLELPRPHSQA